LKKIGVLVVIFICFAAISGSFAYSGHDSNISFENEGVMVSTGFVKLIPVNHELNIELPSNPSTGYKWIAEYDHTKATLLHMNYVPTLPILCGSGGVDVFKFIGKKGAVIHMKYLRTGDKIPIEKRTYYIK
jgi:predicted secreted protein